MFCTEMWETVLIFSINVLLLLQSSCQEQYRGHQDEGKMSIQQFIVMNKLLVLLKLKLFAIYCSF